MNSLPMNDLPAVSIVIVNYNGKHHLKNCFNSILKLNYPQDKIEVVIVDNGSTDGSVELLQTKYKWVKLIRNEYNQGFAKPSTDGARFAKGEYVAFLNNDMRVERDWLIELVNSIERNHAACAGSVIKNWNGELLDFEGGSVSFYGMGYQFNFKERFDKIEKTLTEDRDILFACGGAMLIDRNVFLESGGFDSDYFAYFEDVDLGWRLRVLGHRVVLSVKSRVFHKHHSTGGTFASERMSLLYERNALFTIYKNYGEELFNKAFWPAILIDIVSLAENSGIDQNLFDIRYKNLPLNPKGQKISNISASNICALSSFAQNLNKMTAKRRFIQENRKVDDREIIKYISDPFLCLGKDPDIYNRIKFDFAKTFGIDKAFGVELKRKILLVCSDKIGKKMAGPAIRYYEFAKALSKDNEVVLASSGECDIASDAFKIVSYTYSECDALLTEAKNSDIIIVQGFICEFNPDFDKIAKTRYLIFDLYDPYVIENMEIFKNNAPLKRSDEFAFSLNTLNNQLESGDFFLCANEKQRDYWFGMLSALGRINPDVYDYSNNGDKLVGLVPFGISDDEPKHTRSVLKGVWPGINPDDKVLIWGGGVWNWFDPLTLIRAVKKVSETRSDVKLFFMGVKSPNPDVPEMKMLNDAVALSKELGIYDKYVFFNFGWVDYDDRQNYLLEADIGVSCHFDTVETRFSFRTRILDYLWSNLPIICTEGDYFANLVEEKKLGRSVEYKNVEQFAEAIIELIEDKELYNKCKKNVERVSQKYKWSRVVEPLTGFCNAPRHFKHTVKTEEEKGSYPYDFAISLREKSRKASVVERLNKIESNQASIERMIHSNTMMNENLSDKVEDIQKWTYIMNNRFNKMKRYMNPFRLIKRLIKRH